VARIILDMDDTLCNLNKKWLDTYNERSGDTLTKDKVTSWNIEDCVLPEWQAGPGQPYYESKFFKLLFEPGFFADLAPIPHALEVVEKWRDDGHELLIATHAVCQNANILQGKLAWIRTHMPWFSMDDVVFTARKHLLRADVMVDDNAKYLQKFEGGRIMIPQPWNADASYNAKWGHLRVLDWGYADEALQVLLKH
jgi:5'(3')-deoxyribonucleotidase